MLLRQSTDLPSAELKCDVLIIGTEAAGAKAAIEAHLEGARVLAVTKGAMGRSGTTIMAGSAVQAPLGHMDPRDNPDVFFSDVIKGGAYLNNQKLVERLVHLANSEVVRMEKWGARFVKTEDGKFFQGQRPGSSYPRSLNTITSEGGIQWCKALRGEFQRQGIAPLEDFFVTRLLLSEGQVAGAVGINLADGRLMALRSKITIVATGGSGELFRKSEMPSGATGDGMALAFNAGAELMDMEFQQFFPYHCYGPQGMAGFRIAGLRYTLNGRLYNSRGEEFLERYTTSGKGRDLRDLISRAIHVENKEGRGSPNGGAYLSVSHLPANLVRESLRTRMPKLGRKAEKLGIDLTREALEVGPAAHYTMGGIRVNELCETSLPRLLAIGENAAGMDGAERIDAGPAICWCLTMGYLAGKQAAARIKELDWLPIEMEQVISEQKRLEALCSPKVGVKGHEIKKRIKDIMWERCGLLREKAGLQDGLNLIRNIRENELPRLFVPGPSRCFSVGLVDALEAVNMAQLSEMTLTSALMREESRGSHYRIDFPMSSDRWLKNIIVRKRDGQTVYDTARPVMHRLDPPQHGMKE